MAPGMLEIAEFEAIRHSARPYVVEWSAARGTGQQATLLSRRLDQVTAAEAVCAIVIREGVGEMPYRCLRGRHLRDARSALPRQHRSDLYLVRLQHGRCGLRRRGLPHWHDMHDR